MGRLVARRLHVRMASPARCFGSRDRRGRVDGLFARAGRCPDLEKNSFVNKQVCGEKGARRVLYDPIISACARCHARKSSRPPLRNIRRRVKSGCEWAATTASSLKSESKSNTVGLDTAMAIASSAADGVDCDARSRERS
jgi:hypothetical protein